ncbi:MAG: serine--tRNA ligase [Candidatus Woesearchaeota archaeon]|nr:MAG: serine--tRNA ligase [Candidatus Woesearchaeota archaeon]
MIDIKLLRENPELIKSNILKKFQNQKLTLVDKALELDKKIRDLKSKKDILRHERNIKSEEINRLKKEGKDIKKLIEEVKNIPIRIKETESELLMLEEELRLALLQIPNIIHESVPIGKDASENVEEARYGHYRIFDFEVKSHVEIAELLGVADFDSSAKTSGNGFYYIEDSLALLNQALIRFGIDKMVSKGFRYIETPLMVNKEVITNVTDLHDMKNQIFKIDGEELYLIGTSEHSMIGRYINTVINEDNLPIKNTSYSMCFRKEIGSHGIDEKGLFRTHQFNKIEMIVLCKPEESMKFFEEMKNITVDIFTELEIPIRVLKICSGDLGDLKHCQVDIEAWSPRKKEYFEVGSCSNLTDAQARRLNIKYSDKHNNKQFVHTLNNTAIATSRAMVAILENFQNKDGSIDIPKVLQKYMYGIKKITKQQNITN